MFEAFEGSWTIHPSEYIHFEGDGSTQGDGRVPHVNMAPSVQTPVSHVAKLTVPQLHEKPKPEKPHDLPVSPLPLVYKAKSQGSNIDLRRCNNHRVLLGSRTNA